MKRRTMVCVLCLTVTLAMAPAPDASAAQPQQKRQPVAGPRIPDSEITPLETERTDRGDRTSLVSRRRACKSLVRKANALLEKYPGAANRYRVLGIVFQSQKRLLGMENTARNRNALFDTCGTLARAPDEYAELRFEADMLLSEKALSLKNADLKERADALAELVKRYRGTSAEAKSLMMAALIAPKLEAVELERAILDALDERFVDDPKVIEFRREHLGIRKLNVLFTGTFARADGVSLRLPADRMGRQGLMVFWSRETPGFELYLKRIKEQQRLLGGRFDVFSFNLDELPDAGQATLRALELDWTAMRLPGGKKSQAFRTYARRDPVGILVNAYGYALLTPTMLDPAAQAKLGVRGAVMPLFTLERRLRDARYLAQLRSMLIGDFLVTEPHDPLDPALPPELKMGSTDSGKEAAGRLNRTAESIPAETLGVIQACFTPAPFRYRLIPAEELAHYEKAEKLCRDAITRYPKAPDLWIVRNRRIIALLGMWYLAGEPKHLEHAAAEARASLAATLPPGADIVPRFCLAKEALRRGDSPPNTVLSTFLEQMGGPRAPCSAVAAAAILAIDAHAKDLHNRYRGTLLEAPDGGDPLLWSLLSFLRDPYHRYYLLTANYIRHERGMGRGSIRGYIVAHGEAATMSRLPKLLLKTLDGRSLELPRETNGGLTLLLFVEPPADKTETQFPRDVLQTMKFATGLRDSHVLKEVNVLAAFLCDDPKRVDALMKANKWACRVAMVPGGLKNPLVRRLGILSADRMANVFVLRRDGAVAWHTSGFRYDDFGYPFAVFLAMKVHIEVCDAETAYRALEQRDFRKAVRYFGTPFDPEGDQRYLWAAPRLHGRALAHLGLKEPEAALADIDAAMEAHQKGFNRGQPCPCHIMAEMRLTRAAILDQLGRPEEAKAARRRAADPAKPHSTTPYGLFHEKLKKIRLTLQ